jgi:hypothetical protein
VTPKWREHGTAQHSTAATKHCTAQHNTARKAVHRGRESRRGTEEVGCGREKRQKEKEAQSEAQREGSAAVITPAVFSPHKKKANEGLLVF